MFELGASLRDARHRRGIELAEAEKATRISSRYLRALEEERFELLPGDAYVRGFLGSYADFLGLDADRYLDEYKSRISGQDQQAAGTARPLIQARGATRVAWRPLLLAGAGLVVILLGILAWQFGGSGSSPHVVAHRPTVALARTSTAPSRRAGSRPTTPRAATRRQALTLRAVRGACWLDVRIGAASGRELYVGILAQAGVLRFTLRQPLWLRLGDPASLDATIGGAPVSGFPTETANVIVTSTGLRPA